MSSRNFPVIDVADISLHRKSQDVGADVLEAVGKSILGALCEFGVCFIKNHGIDQGFIDQYFALAEEFFKQPREMKMQYIKGPQREFGYYPYEHENLNTQRPGDLKESFNYHPVDDQADWETKEFHKACKELFDRCTTFGNNILDALSLGLGINQRFLRDAHRYIGQMKNLSALRTLFYPPLLSNISVKHDQIRLGEHSDYGTVSFLFQDDVGGLEVNMPGHGIVPVTPVPGTIVLFAGDLLQRWTSDSVVAIKHMVNIPEVESKRIKTRQSAVFFIIPDNECVVKPLDGSEKYEPVACIDYMNAKLKPTVGITY
jgi:isopenicillin N synthase-like dioxygenase